MADSNTTPWPSVVIANGGSAPDIGTAASLVATGEAHALLYTGPLSLSDATAAVVSQRQPKHVLLVGRPLTLRPAIEDEIREIAPTATVERIAGSDRTSTAAAAAQRTLASDATSVVIANGGSLADVGIAVSLVAVGRSRAVLYAEAEALGDATSAVVAQRQPSHVLLVGGAVTLRPAIEDEIREIAPTATVRRLAGSDRTSTAAAAAQQRLASETSTMVIANGWTQPEIGIAASFAAAHGNTALLYSRKDFLGNETVRIAGALQPDHVILIGNTSTLTTGVHAEVERLLPAARVIRIAASDSVATAAQAAQQTLVDRAPLQRKP